MNLKVYKKINFKKTCTVTFSVVLSNLLDTSVYVGLRLIAWPKQTFTPELSEPLAILPKCDYCSFPLALLTGYAAAASKLLQSCLTLCDPMDGSPPGSPIPGIIQARTLEWVAISFSNAWKWKVKATPWTAAYQAPPSMGFSRQEYRSGVPFISIINYLEADHMECQILCVYKFVLLSVCGHIHRHVSCSHMLPSWCLWQVAL